MSGFNGLGWAMLAVLLLSALLVSYWFLLVAFLFVAGCAAVAK